MLADDVAKARQRQLVDGLVGVRDLDDGLRSIDNAIPQHSIDFDGDAISRDRFLLLCRDGQCSHINRRGAFNAQREDPIEARGHAPMNRPSRRITPRRYSCATRSPGSERTMTTVIARIMLAALLVAVTERNLRRRNISPSRMTGGIGPWVLTRNGLCRLGAWRNRKLANKSQARTCFDLLRQR